MADRFPTSVIVEEQSSSSELAKQIIKDYVELSGVLTNILEDVPQIVIQVLLALHLGTFSYLLIVSIGLSLIAVLVALARRVVLSVLISGNKKNNNLLPNTQNNSSTNNGPPVREITMLPLVSNNVTTSNTSNNQINHPNNSNGNASPIIAPATLNPNAISSSTETCSECELKKVEIYCEQCDSFACFECSNSLHQTIKRKHHTRTKIGNIVKPLCKECDINTVDVTCDDCHLSFCNNCSNLLHETPLRRKHSRRIYN